MLGALRLATATPITTALTSASSVAASTLLLPIVRGLGIITLAVEGSKCEKWAENYS